MSGLVQDVLRSPGQPLDPATRSFMESRFAFSNRSLPGSNHVDPAPDGISSRGDPCERHANHLADVALRSTPAPRTEIGAYSHPEHAPDRFDFSGVRIHLGTAAADSAHAANARAFTVGQHIVFAPGRFDPAHPTGQRLLAHELAHVVQMGATASPQSMATGLGLPVLREEESDSEIAQRRKALESVDWLAAIPPIVLDDNAPVLIAWARKRDEEFNAPETTDNKAQYIAQGLLLVHTQLKTFEARAKRDSTGALVYSSYLHEQDVRWTTDGAQSVDQVTPFTAENISTWKSVSKSPRAATRWRSKKIAAAKESGEAIPEREPPKTATNITFPKQKGMTLTTLEGKQRILMFVLASTRTGFTDDQLSWVVREMTEGKLDENGQRTPPTVERWAPPAGVDLETWKQSFEAIPEGGEVTFTITNSFTHEVNNILSGTPSRRAFQLEAVRQGVVDAQGGVFLGIGVFAIGSLALGGGALLGTAMGLAPGGGIAAGGLLSGGGLIGGGIGKSATAVATFGYLNAPTIFAGGMLAVGAGQSGVSLYYHIGDIRERGFRLRDIPEFAGDLMPFAQGYVGWRGARDAGRTSIPDKGGGGGPTPTAGGAAVKDVKVSAPIPTDTQSKAYWRTTTPAGPNPADRLKPVDRPVTNLADVRAHRAQTVGQSSAPIAANDNAAAPGSISARQPVPLAATGTGGAAPVLAIRGTPTTPPTSAPTITMSGQQPPSGPSWNRPIVAPVSSTPGSSPTGGTATTSPPSAGPPATGSSPVSSPAVNQPPKTTSAQNTNAPATPTSGTPGSTTGSAAPPASRSIFNSAWFRNKLFSAALRGSEASEVFPNTTRNIASGPARPAVTQPFNAAPAPAPTILPKPTVAVSTNPIQSPSTPPVSSSAISPVARTDVTQGQAFNTPLSPSTPSAVAPTPAPAVPTTAANAPLPGNAPVAPAAAPTNATINPATSVWVNTRTGRFHLPGSHWHSRRTAQGSYMPIAQAIAAGYTQAGTPRATPPSGVYNVTRPTEGDPRIVINAWIDQRSERAGFEREMASAAEYALQEIAGWQRAHSTSPGLGIESGEAIRLAPELVNQVFQRQGIEDYLRSLRDTEQARLHLTTETETHPDTLRLKSIHYIVGYEEDGQVRTAFEAIIEVRLNGQARAGVRLPGSDKFTFGPWFSPQ